MKAILVKADPTQPMIEVEGESAPKLAQEFWDHIGFKTVCRVNTQAMADLGLMMVVDDDGLDLKLPVNVRAMIIAQYQGDTPLVGDVLLLSEAMGDDGVHFISVRSDLLQVLEKHRVQEKAEGVIKTLYKLKIAE